MRKLTHDISLDEHSAHGCGVGEALDGTIGNRTHESSLTGIVTTEKTVLVTTLETHLGVVKKNLGTVSKSEITVAKLLSIIIIIVSTEKDFDHLLALGLEGLGGGLGLGLVITSEASKGTRNINPVISLELGASHERAHKVDNVGRYKLVRDFGLGGKGGSDLIRLGLLGVTLNITGLLLKTLELLNGIFGDGTGLGVRHSVSGTLEGREKCGKERGSINRVIDKLGHIIRDHARLTTGGGLVNLKTLDKKGHNHGKSRGLDRLDEGNTSKLVHDLGNFIGVSERANDVLSHVLNIAVTNNLACCGKGNTRSLFDLTLGVRNMGSNLRDNLGESITKLLGSRIAESSDSLECSGTRLPSALDL
jgi:hypothetical protein